MFCSTQKTPDLFYWPKTSISSLSLTFSNNPWIFKLNEFGDFSNICICISLFHTVFVEIKIIRTYIETDSNLVDTELNFWNKFIAIFISLFKLYFHFCNSVHLHVDYMHVYRWVIYLELILCCKIWSKRYFILTLSGFCDPDNKFIQKSFKFEKTSRNWKM